MKKHFHLWLLISIQNTFLCTHFTTGIIYPSFNSSLGISNPDDVKPLAEQESFRNDKSSFQDDGSVYTVYEFDIEQEDPNLVKFGGLSVRQEAAAISQTLHHLSNSEMKVTAVQVILQFSNIVTLH